MNIEESPIVRCIKVLIIGLMITVILDFTISKSNIYVFHSIVEAICIFIGASIFLIIWNTIDKIPSRNYIIGFGFLAAVIFHACHTYLFVIESVVDGIAYDLAIKYWYLGRLTEAIVLYLITQNPFTVRLSKRIILALSIATPIGIAFIIYKFPGIFPAMRTSSGRALIKGVGECIIILFSLFSLINLKNYNDNKDTMSYKNLYIALLITIPTEIILIIFSSLYSLYAIYVHILRISYYYYLYKSVFVSSIEYPYEKIKEENIKLEETYRQLEESKEEETRRQGKLIQQEKLALLGQMGAGIVHETRNYLTTIKGSCLLGQLITREEGVIRHLKKIDKNIEEIDRIMSGFLFMSRPRETEYVEVSMYDLLKTIESLIMTTSLVKKVDVFFETTKEERYLLCDEGQINQVILNLCKNAVEAMEDLPNAKLYLETYYDEVLDEMCISVRDNGKGIAPEDLKKIGTPFFTTKNTGTGLGLYMCYQIIKEHKGRIEVSSELEKGTCFKIMLPCLNEEEEKDEYMNV